MKHRPIPTKCIEMYVAGWSYMRTYILCKYHKQFIISKVLHTRRVTTTKKQKKILYKFTAHTLPVKAQSIAGKTSSFAFQTDAYIRSPNSLFTVSNAKAYNYRTLWSTLLSMYSKDINSISLKNTCKCPHEWQGRKL